MKSCRRYASSAVLIDEDGKEVMIVAGGAGGPTALSTVEVFDGESWRDDVLAAMPEPNWQFCILRINSSTILVAGGK